MEMISLFRETQTVREFADKPLPRELVMGILEDAIWAPNHRFREPWRFIYAEGEGKKKLAATIDAHQHERLVNTMNEAPLCLIVTAKTNKDKKVASDDFAAVCCLIQNIQLLGWAHGVGMAWDLADYSGWTKFQERVGIQENERIAGILTLGFFEQNPAKPAPIDIRDKVEVW